MKPHKGMLKRVKVTARGKIKYKRSNAGHLMSVKSSKRRRRFRRDKVMSAAMTKGLAAALNSATALNYECVRGGATTMWDIDDQWVNFERMKAILKTFLSRGGMIFQGNTTSVAELEKAMVEPDKHPNLTVRVGGFSARFVTLDEDLQREIIHRRRHEG